MGELKKIFDPETIVLMGTDNYSSAVEKTMLKNLILSDKRRMYAVSKNIDNTLNFNCRPTLEDIDEHIDLAVITVPDESVLESIEQCAQKGVEGAIVMSTGPKITQKGRKTFESDIREIRKNSGMRIIGPDSKGIILPNAGLKITSADVNPLPGNSAFITQSGTLGNAMLYWAATHRIGISMFVSLGSMYDVDFADIIDFLQEDYFTRSIMLYLEHISDTKKFLSAARCFARNKPIVALKPGRYPQSTQALIAHIGRETGRDNVYDAAFRRVGIVRVKETEDFFDTAEVLVSKSLPLGCKLAVITNSGGIGIIICDTIAEQKGQIARLSESSIENICRVMPVPPDIINPVDILEDADVERYIEIIDICAKDEGVDGIIVVHAPTSYCDSLELSKHLASLSKKTAKPFIAVWMGGKYQREDLDFLREAAIPVYETPEDAVRAYMYMYNYRRGIELINETPEEMPSDEARLTNHLKILVRNAIKEGKEILAGEDASGFLKNYGISVLKGNHGADKHDEQENIIDEWAIRCIRDIDFGAVILLISMKSEMRQTGFAIGLPPLNRVLARRLMEDAGFPFKNSNAVKKMEEVLINFSNLIVDFPEFLEIEIESAVTDNGLVHGKNAMIQIDKEYKKGVAQYPHLVIMPYPSRYIMPWKLRNGKDVILRPLRAEDEPMVNEMISNLSEETLRVRFFVLMEINHRMLMQFCNIDYDREIAIVAEMKDGEARKIIGGGRIIIEPGTKSGQFALLVSDDFQKQGMGEKFLDIIIGIAQDKGLQEVYGIVLSENEKMLRLSRKMGFTLSRLPDGITRVSLQLD